MATLYTHSDKNIRKTRFLITVFLVFIVGIGWLFSYVFQSYAILIVAVFLSVIMSFSSYWYSDKIVLSLSRAAPLKKDDNPELYRIVENLSITAGLPMPKVYVMEEAGLNAFATGRDPEHAVIVVTRGLIKKLDKLELEGVIAHEMSHIGNKDILLSTVIVILVGLVALLSDFFIRWSFWGGLRRRGSSRDSGQLQTILIIAAVVLAILAPVIATIIRLAVSRKREFLADASGALLTRYPEGLARALEKIAGDQVPLRAANNATAHLFINNPFKGKEKKRWFHKIFMTHPPIQERVRALRGIKV